MSKAFGSLTAMAPVTIAVWHQMGPGYITGLAFLSVFCFVQVWSSGCSNASPE